MAFNYLSPSGIRLTNSEEQILDRVDKFSYPLNGYANLADLHSRKTVELSDKIKTRDYSYEITYYERVAEIDKLQERINKIDRLIDQKMQKFEEAQGTMRDALGRQLGELEVERALLRDIRGAYVDAEQGTNGNFVIHGCYEILGEYISSSKKVVLYYNSIRYYNNSDYLLAIVYVHEMMHAYLDGGTFIKEIEEPIVEYAMLNFFKAFDRQICEVAEKHVKDKQKTMGISHYGFGYCIFKNPNGIKWLEDYRNAKNSIAKTDLNVVSYLDYWKTGVYPEKKEKECLEAMYKALHGGAAKQMKISSNSSKKPGLIEQSKNCGDLLKKLDDYLNKHKPVPTSHNVSKDDFKKWLKSGLSDGSARTYIRSIDRKEFHDFLDKQCGIKSGIYSCKDLNAIKNAFEQLLNNNINESKEANDYGNGNMVSAFRHWIEFFLKENGIRI